VDGERRFGAVPPALLEDWLRDYYFELELDIGCSGVEEFSLPDLLRLTDLSLDDLSSVVFRDSHSLGGPGLRRAIADRFSAGDESLVMATHGSSEAIFLVAHALLAAGDEVVVLDPCYQQLAAVAESIGCRLRRWKLRFEDAFAADLGELRRLVGPRTRMLIVNFPHNPTGTTITPEEQEELLAIAARAGAYLVWDGAFTELTYDAAPLPEPARLYQRAISLGTLSKAYGLPGLRVGWCLAPPKVLQRLVRLRDYVTLALSPLVEVVARRAIEAGDRLVGARLDQARRNRRELAEWAESQPERVEWVVPRGGVTAFPRLPLVADSETFCHELARRDRVLLVPGTCFGAPQHVRLGFGGSPIALRQGLRRLEQALQQVMTPTAAGRRALADRNVG
jgi:capreomycidine synthase